MRVTLHWNAITSSAFIASAWAPLLYVAVVFVMPFGVTVAMVGFDAGEQAMPPMPADTFCDFSSTARTESRNSAMRVWSALLSLRLVALAFSKTASRMLFLSAARFLAAALSVLPPPGIAAVM